MAFFNGLESDDVVAMIKVENLNKFFGDLHVLKDINLEVNYQRKAWYF